MPSIARGLTRGAGWRVVRGLPALAGVIVWATGSPAGAARPFDVIRVLLRPAGVTAVATGYVSLSTTVRADEVVGAEQALLAGSVSLQVRDAGVFRAQAVLEGCVRNGLRIVCANPARTVLAVLAPAGASGAARLRVRMRRLEFPATDDGPPEGPVTVQLTVATRALVDVISECRPSPFVALACRDSGRPNVVIILSDDQRWDTLSGMPHVLDRLGAQGVTFSNAFAPTPTCAPARASILTGQYAHRHRVLNNLPNGGGIPFVAGSRPTLATGLRAAGYRTGMYGKYGNHYLPQCPPTGTGCYVPPGWDEWHGFVLPRYYDYQLVEQGTLVSYGTAATDYSTDVLAAKAVDFILAARGQPFFLLVGLQGPHQEGGGPPIPAPRHLAAVGPPPAVRAPSWNEADVADKPTWIQELPRAWDVLQGFLTYGGWSDVIGTRQITTLLAVDEAVDSIMSALEVSGVSDDTVVIFLSDNGHFWGEHRYFWSKGPAYEESIRIPLVVRWPRVVRTVRDEPALAMNIDLAPTIAQLAGLPIPTSVQGRSLVPLLQDEPVAWRTDLLLEHTYPDVTSYAGVRTEQWKYITYPNTAGVVELYDLVNDPYELDNRASDPTTAGVQDALRSRLDALRARAPLRRAPAGRVTPCPPATAARPPPRPCGRRAPASPPRPGRRAWSRAWCCRP